MSRGYRRDEGGYGDDDGGGTWDRGRFERARARSRGPYGRREEYDTVNVEEDRYISRGEGPVQEKIRVSVNDDRFREPPPREYERRRYVEEERFSPPQRQRPEFLDEGRYVTAGREMQVQRGVATLEKSSATPTIQVEVEIEETLALRTLDTA